MDNYTLNVNITNSINIISFSNLHGFGVLVQTNIKTYYVLDNGGNKIHMFNDSWAYVGNASLDSPSYMVTIGNYLFITSDSNIYKTDSRLNVLDKYSGATNNPSYRGIYFNCTESIIYVASVNRHTIYAFNLNLTLNYSINTSNHHPYSISQKNGILYVGTYYHGNLLVIVNRTVISSFNSLCSSALTSIRFDSFGYMTTLCTNSQMLLYFTNRTYIKTYQSIPINSTFIGFDSKRFVFILSQSEVNFYNYSLLN